MVLAWAAALSVEDRLVVTQPRCAARLATQLTSNLTVLLDLEKHFVDDSFAAHLLQEIAWMTRHATT
eukprot:6942798-Prorocentrum_lima.AAC.1